MSNEREALKAFIDMQKIISDDPTTEQTFNYRGAHLVPPEKVHFFRKPY